MTNFLIEPPTGLFEKIMARIHREERFILIRRLFVFSGLLAGSLIGIIPSFKLILSEASSSGFFNFSSLIFSDFSLVVKYWQSFGMAILQTLPAVGLAIFLAVILVMLQSIKSLVKNVKTLATI